MSFNFGERIKERRAELKISQAALAKRAGVSQGTIAQIESGRNQGSAKIIDLARALNVAPEWLLYGKNPPIDPKISVSSSIQNDECFITANHCSVGLKLNFVKQNKWDAEYLDFTRSPDESMSPTIGIFDDVAFNRLEVSKQESGIFVIERTTGLIMIRRLILDTTQNWIYRCDNLDKTRFSDVYSNIGDKILGRVVWRGGANHF